MKFMKKLMLILLASFSLAACGDGSKRTEANRDESEYSNTEPSFETEDNDAQTQSDTTRVMDDTTTMEKAPAR